MPKPLFFTAIALVLGALAAPASAQEIDFVHVEIRTGGDDLRGNDDNAFASIWSYRADGRQRGIRQQVNRDNRRLRDYTSVRLTFDMPDGTEIDDVTSFHLEVDGFSGGFDGDNWNVDSIRITATRGGILVHEYMNEFASPLMRFTGDNRRFYRNMRVK